jgi:hypothetical protein
LRSILRLGFSSGSLWFFLVQTNFVPLGWLLLPPKQKRSSRSMTTG